VVSAQAVVSQMVSPCVERWCETAGCRESDGVTVCGTVV